MTKKRKNYKDIFEVSHEKMENNNPNVTINRLQ